MTRILAPSDLLNTPTKAPVSVGGRVLAVSGHEVLLADALGHVSLAVSPSLLVEATPGDLLECVIQQTADGFLIQQITSHQRCPEPTGGGEFLRLTSAGRGTAIAARSRAYRAIRRHFEAEGFVEVDTPTFVPSPGLDPHVDSLAPVVRGDRRDFLITSPEFHMKRLLAGGLPRIYQVARCFRAEELGDWHEPEFTLLEWYRSFASWEQIAADTEGIVRAVFRELEGPHLQSHPFNRLSIREAFQKYANVSDAIQLAQDNPDEYFELLTSRVEPALCQREHPVFLTHYPLSQAALAQPDPEDPTVAQRFELYVAGIEISNGYGELTDPSIQHQRFQRELQRRKASGAPCYPIDQKLLSALIEGLPRCSGNALGLDRLIALALGQCSIGSTLSFTDAER